MKIKKILTGALASALLVSAMPAFSAFAEDNVGNTIPTASDASFGETISNELEDSFDKDWYKITVPSSGKVTIMLSASYDQMNYEIYGADDSSTPLDYFYNTGDYITCTHYLYPGDYYIKLYDARCTYDMKIAFKSSNVTIETEDNNTLKKATAVECDGTDYVRQFSLNDAVDYYSFELAEKGRVTLNFDSDMDNTDWELYDSEDALIKNGTFRKGELDSGISAKDSNILKAGKYKIAFKKKDSYGPYTFSLDYLKNYNDISVSGIIAAADLNEDGSIDSSDASLILTYYAYISTGGTETDMNKWLAQNKK